jgi:hypothetical protein
MSVRVQPFLLDMLATVCHCQPEKKGLFYGLNISL